MGLFTSYTKDAAQVVESENDTIGKKAIAFLTAPIGFSSDELVEKTTQTVNILGWSGIALLGGELLGHRRAAQGKRAFIPVGRP